ncbi:hypothetical protein LIER_20652 [Lithospermum erythrorhizon]|uniref:Uncharacterized protein n=1 Tax=Lithospermum erythrorhizon TaxID=34254 RepID=A0AAV3QN74_LITER
MAPALKRIFVVALENGLRLPVHPFMGDLLSLRPFFFFVLGEGHPTDVPASCSPYRKSTGALLGSTKHKAHSASFAAGPMPLNFYSYPRFLKAVCLTPGSVTDLSAREALRATYNVSDHVPSLFPVFVLATSSDQQPLRHRRVGDGEQLLGIGQGDGSPPEKVSSSPWAFLLRCSLYCLPPYLDPKDHGKVGSAAPQAITPSPLPTLVVQVTGPSPLALEGPLTSKKRIGFPPYNPRPAESQRRSDKAPLSQLPAPPVGESSVSKKSSTDPSHEELTSILSTLGDKFFELQGVTLYSYRRLLTSLEEASTSSSQISQVEQDLRAFKMENASEEGTLQRRLKNLVGDHDILKERYASRVCRTEVVKVELEGMKAERDSAQLERESLRTRRNEALLSNDRFLGQLTESSN